MPEASINEDGDSLCDEIEIGTSRNVGAMAFPTAEAKSNERRSHTHFG